MHTLCKKDEASLRLQPVVHIFTTGIHADTLEKWKNYYFQRTGSVKLVENWPFHKGSSFSSLTPSKL